MASKEAIELLENVLNESKNFRNYKKAFSNKVANRAAKFTDDVMDKDDYDIDHPIKSAIKAQMSPEAKEYRKDIKNMSKDYRKLVGAVGTYAPDQIKAGLDAAIKGKENTNTPGYKAGAKHYKKEIAKRVAAADAAHRSQVVGGYKLEAAQILIEALNTLLNE